MRKGPQISLVVPVLNEAEGISVFLDRVRPILERIDPEFEIIFVDDGSSDATAARASEFAAWDGRIRLLQFTRNFGKEAAITAGLEWAGGEAVIPIDVDLQDPPELIGRFVELWQQGYDVVFGQRVQRGSDTGVKRWSAHLFYRGFNAVSEQPIDANAGDFRLMSRSAVEATLRLRERNRFMKGLFAWIGYETAAVPYERPARAVGTTKFGYWKLWNFAIDGITSFSTVPLRVWTYVGLSIAAGAVVYTAVITFQTLMFGREVPGYASLMVTMLFLGAVQLVSLGIIGEYLGRLYLEAKQRPIYLLREAVGFEQRVERQPTRSAPVLSAEAPVLSAEASVRSVDGSGGRPRHGTGG